jgi:hypothetical protein
MISFPIEFTEIFPGFVRVIVADSVLSGLKYWSKRIDEPLADWIKDEEEHQNNGLACEVNSNGSTYFSIIVTKNSSFGTLIHESLHMAHYILAHYYIYFDRTEHEILCRTQQALLNKILPELKKRKIELR